MVELRQYTTYFLPPWAHEGALIHRWRAGTSSTDTITASVTIASGEERWRAESWDFKETEGFKVYIIKEDLRSLRYNPTSEEECESK